MKSSHEKALYTIRVMTAGKSRGVTKVIASKIIAELCRILGLSETEVIIKLAQEYDDKLYMI